MNVARLCLALTVFLLTTSLGLADDILGTWLRDSGDEQVKFGPCGDALCGDIVWLKPGSDLNAKVGKRLFFDVRPSGANAWTGKAASSDTGSTYSGKMSVEGSTLITSGCIAGGLICKSANWKRVP
ncbi:MAG TPA: DUF2147 domain-containing protein [Bradyrhizobium sp.]|jgi:uncharacterized protein (DUF2147 family)